MKWYAENEIIESICTLIEMNKRYQNRIRFMGQMIDYQNFKKVYESVIGIDIRNYTKEEISEKFSYQFSNKIHIPEDFSKDMVINSEIQKFLLENQIYPLSVLFCIFSGERKIRKNNTFVKFHTDASDEITAEITISNKIKWDGEILTIKSEKFPESMIMSMIGKSLSEIIDHPWQGWENIRVLKCTNNRNSVHLKTDAKDLSPLE